MQRAKSIDAAKGYHKPFAESWIGKVKAVKEVKADSTH